MKQQIRGSPNNHKIRWIKKLKELQTITTRSTNHIPNWRQKKFQEMLLQYFEENSPLQIVDSQNFQTIKTSKASSKNSEVLSWSDIDEKMKSQLREKLCMDDDLGSFYSYGEIFFSRVWKISQCSDHLTILVKRKHPFVGATTAQF